MFCAETIQETLQAVNITLEKAEILQVFPPLKTPSKSLKKALFNAYKAGFDYLHH